MTPPTPSPTGSTGRSALQAFVRRLATKLGGEVRVRPRTGPPSPAFGRAARRRPSATYTSPVDVDGADAGHARRRPAGAASATAASCRCSTSRCSWPALLSVARASRSPRRYVAARLTRPLRDVADAARRLGAGETDGARDRRRRPRVGGARRFVQRDGRPPRALRDAPAPGRQRHRPRPRHARDRPRLADPGHGRRRRAGRPREPRGGPFRGHGAGQHRRRAQRPRERRGRAAPGPADRVDLGAAIHELERELDGLRRERGRAPRVDVPGRRRSS